MVEVKFIFDKYKDAWNIWDKCNRQGSYGDDWSKSMGPNLIKICKGKSLEGCREEIFQVNKKIYESKLIEIFLESIKTAWSARQDEFFEKMNKLFCKKFNNDLLTCCISTIGVCPYNFEENWFMCSLFSSLPNALVTCAHEIMHIYFHKFYWHELEEKIGEEKTSDLKEALTVLLNLEFKDLFFGFDKGYKKHKELREFICDEWKRDKDFERLLNKCVMYLGKN